jgi:predicted permease
MVLLVGAGLLVATLISLARTDAGFDPDGLIAIRLPQSTMHEATPTERWNLEQRVMERLEGSAVVAGIAGASNLPFERGVNTPMTISGTPDSWGTVEWRAVTPNYFEVLGIRITQGRAFESADGPGGARVAIVNESFADRHFPGESPLGQHIDVGRVRGEPIDTLRPADAVEIVGVASDIREVSLRLDPRRTIYVPQAQASDHLSNVMGTPPVFIARQRVAGANVEPTIARALEDIDATLARPVALPLDDILARTLARERFGATLVSLLAVLALALTALGIHAVLAYSVEHRRREIGIRMAMGAASHEVTRFIAGQGIAPVIPGLVLGTLASWSLSRLIASFLWGVSPADPVTIAAVALLLLGVAVCAAWIPARRAAKLDPVKALTRD